MTLTYVSFYAFSQNSQCQPLKCQALKDVGNYCEESRCKNQWIPYLSLQERWTSRDAIAARKGWKSHSMRMKAKGSLHQPPLTAASREWAVRESGALGSVRTVHSTLPLQFVVSSVGKSGRFGSGGTSCGKMNCLSAQAVLENLHAGGVGTRAPPASYVQWVGKRVCVTIADCGTNISKCWVNNLCITMNCSSISAKLQMDCNCFCTEKSSVCGTKWILLSYIHTYYELILG